MTMSSGADNFIRNRVERKGQNGYLCITKKL